MAANADRPETGLTAAPPSTAERGAVVQDGAALCVDVLVAGAGGPLGDRPLTYAVPPALRPFAAVGMRAVVPLGRRRALGFVLGVRRLAVPADQQGAAAQHTRAVLDFPDDAPLFSDTLLSLAREVAEETLSSLRGAVECLVPPEVVQAPIPPRPRVVVRDASCPLPPRLGRRQTAVLALIAQSATGVSVPDITRAGGAHALRRLVTSGVLRVEERPRALDANGLAPAQAVAPASGLAGGPGAQSAPTLLIGDADARAARIALTVAAAVRGGDRAMVAVPEIADAAAMAERLAREGRVSIAVLHSGLSPRERRDAWLRARAGGVDVVVGTRSALFTPLPRLGVIVLDDEQNAAYKSEAAPRYHARDVAFRRARLERTRLILGSAAPSVEMSGAVASGAAAAVALPARRPVPVVTLVDMRAEERRGHVGYLSRALVQAMSRHLRAGGRVALLVSRRGYARVLLCRECGAAVRCPSCDIATAYDRDRGAVSCRVCGHTGRAPDLCPRCGGVGLRGVGAGTKRIEEVVHRLFPALRMARLDAETSRGAGRVLRDFAEGRLRLLVGTPMVLRARFAAAGRARPTLVGIVDADGPLYLPDFRAAEHTLQRLRAAAELPAPLTACAAAVPPPRAPSGARLAPEVIVQTRVPDHPVLRAFRTGDDAVFYDSELAARRDLGYPPYARLVRVVAESPTPEAARTLAGRVASAARGRGLDVLGPAPLLGRKTAGYGTAGGTRDRARVQCVLRVAGGALRVPGAPPADDADARRTIRAVLAEVPAPRGARIIVDVDPQEMV